MEKEILKDLASGLVGELTHLHPKKAVKGLTPEIARKKPTNLDHSCCKITSYSFLAGYFIEES